ncbi:MAG: hypothetical protein ACOYN6_06065 [Ignavibacteria bacterium]
MTTLLKKAIDKTSLLSEDEQNKIAQIILDEISDDEIWNEKFNKSQEQLSILAEKALNEYKSGKTNPFND